MTMSQRTLVVRNKRQKARFGIVGFISTSIDFGVLFLLSGLGLSPVGANFISTGAGFCFSFIANRHFAFKATNGNLKKQLAIFFIVTFAGIWGIQPVIIWAVSASVGDTISPDWLLLLVAKLSATFVTLLWNYFFYSRVVFKDNEVPM